jgi:tRNA A37 threonylcarbamoyladenosine dehydratase
MNFTDKRFTIAASIGMIALTSIIISDAIKRYRKKKLLQEIDKEINFNTMLDENDLVKEQLSRNIAFLGDKQENVDKSFVIVIGLGGVGSHAVQMLCRSGVRKIRIIDFDQVTLSSLNRHAVAKRYDVGISKVECMKKHLLEILPEADIDAVAEMFSKESAERMLDGNPDFVLDCIDNIHTKIDLLEYCFRNKIRVVSSMGSGAKSDPTRIHVADISETFGNCIFSCTEDPLARATRKGLRFRGINSGVKVIYSSEKPGDVKLLPLQEDQVKDANELAALPKFRARILPVLGPIPALFGMTMAAYVLTELAQFNTTPLAFKQRNGIYQRLHAQLCQNELQKYSISNVPLTVHDISYIFEEVRKVLI